MPINFPSSPTPGQVFTDGDHVWQWSSTTGVVGAWKLQTQTATGPTGPTGPTGSTGPTGPTGAEGAILTLNAQTGTTYTLALTDTGKLVTLNNASPITVTIPLNSSVAFTTGSQVNLLQLGVGRVTIAGASGVTVNSPLGLITRTRYSIVTCVKTATDTWVVTGDSAVT